MDGAFQLPIGEMAAISAAILWAFTSLIFTEAGRLATPLAANTFKTICASFILGIVLWIKTGLPYGVGIGTRDLLFLGASGICGLAIGDSLLFLGFQALGTRRANLVFALAPVMGVLGGLAFLGETLDLVEIAGISAAIGGVAWVVSERRGIVRSGSLLRSLTGHTDDRRHPLEGRTLFGILVTVAAAFGQAGAALLAKPALERVATLEATQIRVGAAAVTLLLGGAVAGRLPVWTELIVRQRLYVGMALASFLGPFLGIWLMTVSLDHTSTGVALTLLSTPPIWLLPLGAWLQHDFPTRRELLGLLVALAGVAVLLLRGA